MTTTIAEPVTATLEAPGATITYDVRRNDDDHRAAAVPARLADGRVGLRDAREPLPGPDDHHLRPARRGAQHQGRPGHPVHAPAARGRHPPRDRGGRPGPGRPVREQRRRGQRPRARRGAPGGRPHARGPRAAAGLDPARRRQRQGGRAGDRRQLPAGGFGAGMAHFIAIVAHKGEFPDDIASQPGPDPAMFGMPAGDDGSRTDVMLAQNIITCTHYQPDFDALRAASTHIILAAGEESEGEMANRGAHAVARAARHAARRLPEQPRRVPGRRVRPGRPAGRLRREAPRGPRLRLSPAARPATSRRRGLVSRRRIRVRAGLPGTVRRRAARP